MFPTCGLGMIPRTRRTGFTFPPSGEKLLAMPGRSLLQLGLFGALLLSCQAATFTVTTTADSGAGSLRAAIDAANAAGAGTHNINFSGVSGTITLQSMLPIVTGSVNIAGPGAGSLTISGNDQVRAFFIDANAGAVRISNLTLADGYAKGGNGADGGGGGLGAGGAIFVNDGAVTLSNVAFVNNAAAGGDGATQRTTGTPYGTTNFYYSAGGGGGLGGDGGIGGNGGGGGGGFGGDGGSGTLGPGGGGGISGNGGDGHVAYNNTGYVVGGGGGGTADGGDASNGVPGLGAGGGGDGGSSTSYHLPGTDNDGAAGTRYGGGGGAGFLADGGDGGEFGGGGGGAPKETPAGSTSGTTSAGDGGDFGGGGGASSGLSDESPYGPVYYPAYAGDGGFGGGGGGAGTTEYAVAIGGVGGFGGGGGSGASLRSGGGGAFGQGGDGTSGGGGAALGGNVFVRASNGAFLTYEGGGSLAGGSLTGGWGGGGGATAGGALFLLGGVTTFSAGSGETLTITGDIAGWSGDPATVRKEGAGTLVLGGNNSWHGGTQLAGGVVSVSTANNLGAASGPLVFGGGALRITGTTLTTLAQAIQFNTGGGTIEVVEGLNTFTFTSALTGSGALAKQGAGGLIFADSVGFTGIVDLQGGALTLGGFGSAQLATGTVLTLVRDTDLTFASSMLTGAGAFAKVGAGTLFLQADQTFSGGFSAEGGVVEFDTLARFGTGTITLNDLTLRWATGATADPSARLAPLGAGGVAFDTNGNNVTFAHGLHATGTFTKLGNGALALNGANQFDATVTVENGEFEVSGTTQFDAAVSAENSTLRLTGATTFADSLTLTDSTLEFAATTTLPAGSLHLDDVIVRWLTGNTTDLSSRLGTLGTGGVTFDTNGNNVTFATAFAAAGSVTKAGAGTLRLTAASTRTTGTFVTGGAIALDDALALQASTVTVNATHGLTFNGTAATLGALAGTGDLALGTTALTVGGNDASTLYSGALTGSATLTKAGTGQWTLTGNTAGYGGAVQVTGGTLAVPNLAALGSGQTTLNGGGLVLAANGATSSSSRPLVIGAGGGSLDVANQSLTLGGLISGGNFEKRGSGLLVLTADNTYANTLVSGGTLQLGDGGTTGRGGTGTYTLANSATLVVDRSDDFAFASALTGTGDLVKRGSTQLKLTAGGNLIGTTTIQAGSLYLGADFSANVLAINAGGHVVTGTGTLSLANLDLNHDATIDVAVRSTGSFANWNLNGHALNLSAPLSGVGMISLNGDINSNTDEGKNSLTLAAGSSDPHIYINGSNLFIHGGQTYTSALTLSDSARLSAADTTPLVVSGVTTLEGYNLAFGSTNPARSGALTINTVKLTSWNDLQIDSDVTIGSLQGSTDPTSHALVKHGAGTLTVQALGGDYNKITAFQLEEGVLAMGGSTRFIKFTFNGGSLRYTADSSSREVAVQAGGGSVDTQGYDVTWTGALTGAGALTKTGTGRLTLNTASGYTGAFTVAEGILMLNNSTLRTSRLTVNSAGRLEGMGTVNGPVTLAGTFAPGFSVGALTTGNLSFTSTSVFEWELNDALGTAGTTAGGWDFATVNGTLSFAAGSTLSLVTLDLNNAAGLAANFNGATDYRWIMATATGGITGAELLALDTDRFQNSFGGTFTLEVDGNNLVLNYVGAVPEPATYALLAGLSGLALVAVRRRRR